MKIKFGGGIVDARGSIAGNTYSRNHYGAFVRARVSPVNPNTARQVAVRAAIAFLSAYWANTLTLAQRTAWNLYGSSVAMLDSLGATIYLTGYNHFIRSNLQFRVTLGAAVAAGPVIFEIPAQDPAFAMTCTEAAQTLSISFDNTLAWANETGATMWLYQGKPQNAQRYTFFGPWRYVDNVLGDDVAAPVSPVVVAAQYAIAEGQHQWVYGRIRRLDGRLSAPFRADSFCLA